PKKTVNLEMLELRVRAWRIIGCALEPSIIANQTGRFVMSKRIGVALAAIVLLLPLQVMAQKGGLHLLIPLAYRRQLTRAANRNQEALQPAHGNHQSRRNQPQPNGTGTAGSSEARLHEQSS